MQLEKLCSPAIWAEGPVWLSDHNAIIFSDVKGNRMYRWHREHGLTVWRPFSNYANGNTLDHQGRLLTCEHGRRGISRTEHDGSITLLIDRVEGKRFNSPNDLAVHQDGSIWFTDPPYGIIGDIEGYHAHSQIIGCYVYRFDPKSGEIKIIISDVQRPNGLAFSPDQSLLYVADMSIADFPGQGRRQLRVYELNGDQNVAGRFFAQVEPGLPDGFCVDGNGDIYCSCLDGVIIFDKMGNKIGKIDVPETVSNCTIGGPDNNELYITATTSLYCIRIR